MAKIRRVLRCFRCGTILQTEDPKKPGFIARELLNKATPESVLYCHKCFEDMKMINIGGLNLDVDNDILTILEDAVATDAIVVWVIDLFTFNGLLNPDIVKKIRNLKVIVAGTKFDLFPRGVKSEQLKDFVKYMFKESGLSPYKVQIFGSTDKIDYKKIFTQLNDLRAEHDIYMIGSSNSGKTTIINRFLKNYSNKSRWTIKQEIYPGTRTKVLEIPLSNSSFFYELPSLSLANSVLSKVEKDIAKMLLPKKTIKVSQRTLTNKEALVIGNLAVFSLVEGQPTLFKLFTSEMAESRKVDSSGLNNFMVDNYRRRMLRPVSDCLDNFTRYDIFEYDMEDDKKLHDISIRGLGWVSFVATGQTIRVMLPKGAALKESLSKVKI